MDNLSKDDYKIFLKDVKDRIKTAQYEALRTVNKQLVSLYWDLGKLIVEKQETLGWGKSVVEKLSVDLQNEFPGITGFSARNLWRIRNFYYTNIMKMKNCHHWWQKLAGRTML